MALADTARLVASLELQDKFSATANKFDQRIGSMDRHVSAFGRNVGIAAAAGIGFLSVNVARGIQSLQELEEVTVATDAAIASTGGVAGQTAEDVRALAEKYEALNATMDDKVIQSAENMLLTFTNITDKAFEPALEAALNLNEAMGGGEDGLQTAIIQVGKALNDPIQGIGALRRVGVQLSDQQEIQIRQLVEQNDLYGAQQVILGELTTQFGGRFAAAGDTLTGKFAKFKDAVEDAQMTLAVAFLPVLEKVADKLTEFLADPRVQAGIKTLGEDLAEGFDALIEIAGNLPWEAIGQSFQLMGTGAKALLTAFTSLPPWVQTAVLTGWGLNKLTGGALTSIAGALASGLIKGVLGINAGVVNINAATVNGGAPGATGPAGAAGSIIRPALVATLGAAIGLAIGSQLHDAIVSESRDFEEERFSNRGRTIEDMQHNLEAIESSVDSVDDLQALGVNHLVSLITGQESALDILNRQHDTIQRELTSALLQEHLIRENTNSAARDSNREIVTNSQLSAQQQAAIDRMKSDLASLGQQSIQRLSNIENKDFSPTVSVGVTSNVSITDITRRLVSFSISQGVRGGFTVE